MNKKAIIYTRVSTKNQNPEMQLHDLKEYANKRNFDVLYEYVDFDSGMNSKRENLKKMLDNARKRLIDVIIVWRFDRLSRNTSEMIRFLDEFNHLGIDFISYTENIDTASPDGRYAYILSSAFAEQEKNINKERTINGIENARRKGKILGRPKISESDKRRAIALYKQKKNYKQIIKATGISKSKYFEIITEYKNESI